MKKISILLMLMALFGPLAMMGQQTLVVANGTGTHAEIPFYGLYADDNYQHTQTIYPSSMLTQMEGGTITKLTYHLSSSATKDYGTTFEIRLGTTSSTSFSTGTVNYISMTGSPAYSNTLSVSGTTVEFNLSTPYTYNGGNLVVDVRTTTLGSGWQSLSFYGESGSTAYSVKNKSTSSLPTSTGTAVTFMPKTTFTYLSTDPYITLAPAAATVLTGFTETLTATYGNVSGTPTITYTSSNTSVATVNGSGTTATVTGVAPGTATITATMNGSYTATCAITVEDPSYCKPSFSNTSDYIKSFTTTGGEHNISNASNGQGTGGYSDFYNSHYVSAEPGTTISFSVVRGYSDTYQYGLWVDWNKDYVFDNSTEKMASTSSAGDWSSSFTIPANTAAGDYHMRVLQLYGSSTTLAPCASASYGEGEDYKLTVLSTGAYTITCATTTGGTISADKNNADENDVITITATPDTDYLLTALTYTPEGGSAQSINIASTPYTFTMPAANVTVNATFTQSNCPRPTNVTVSNVTYNSATISWESSASDYELEYAKLGYIYNFDDGTLQGWTNLKVNSAGGEWISSDNNGGGYDYTTAAHSGECFAMSYSFVDGGGGSYNTNVYLVSPQRYEITSSSASLNFFYAWANSEYPDYLEVCVSTAATPTASSFTSLGWSVGSQGSSKNAQERQHKNRATWNENTLSLSSYVGQSIWIAFHHKANDQYEIWIDDVTVDPGNSSWIPAPGTIASPYILEGLDSETQYAVRVKAICGGTDGESTWSDVVSFTTDTPCTTPYDLNVTNITAASATLNWTGYQDSYTVKYGEQYYYDNFDENQASDWTQNDGSVYSWSGTTNYFVLLGYGSSSGTQYLISPDLSDIAGGNVLEFSQRYYQGSMTFYVGYSSTTSSTSAFTWGSAITASPTAMSHIETIPAGTKYIAIRTTATNSNYGLVIDEFRIYSQTITTANAETLPINGLEPNSEYFYQVQGINSDCNGGTTRWSDVATFTTREGQDFTKHIVSYNDNSIQNWGGWYLIASPLADATDPTAVTNMTSNTYDLYRFDQTAELEWINYLQSDGHTVNTNFGNLVAGQGYLYANSQTVDLVFTGTAYSGNVITLTYDETNPDSNMHGWNLIGNPLTVEATINEDMDFMEMNDVNAEITLGDGIVEAMGGIFVQATATGQSVTFSPANSGKTTGNGERIMINISQNQMVIDRAAVRFGEGQQLPKYQLNQNSTKVYIPVDGEDFAVVRSEGIGALPVNFKAEENGNYTLSLNTEGMSFGYLHLVDNMTGNDIDMLANPSYSFEARTTDYASRFKLVFATGDNANANFAYFSNGSFVINNGGNATLQVIDVNGRILKSESINGCTNLNFNAAPGVYMIRLINGDNVKVQKVVVK